MYELDYISNIQIMLCENGKWEKNVGSVPKKTKKKYINCYICIDLHIK